jgi:hypothetical protein
MASGAKNMKNFDTKIGYAILIAAMIAAGSQYFKHHVEIDRCLDSGGAWNYEAGMCKC